MMQTVRVRRRIATALIIISAAAWIILLIQQYGSAPHSHTHHGSRAGAVSVDNLLAWCLMLIAMMVSMLTAPLVHVWERSFKRVRAPSMALFVAGYMAVWMLAGAVILQTIALPALAVQSSALVPLAILLITLIWQCSPLKQRCLNRNHNHSALRAFGWAARFDALRFGVRHGLWCVGSCWGLMLFPMVLTTGELAAMAVVTIIMVTEKFAPPNAPQWRIRGFDTAIAVLRGQIRSRINARGRRTNLDINNLETVA